MYQRVKGSSRLDSRQLALLRELAAWREDEARTRDWPRAHVLPDDVLVALALRAPADRKAFDAVQGVPRNMPDAVVAAVLAAVARGLAVPGTECPPASPDTFSSRRSSKSQSDRLLAHIREACAPHGVDPALVASRADADAFVLCLAQGDTASHPLSRGWRQALVAQFTL
jgi:ribonuclease D